MVIIPTEKRFDWQHTPFALLAIIFINIVIFLSYQSADQTKVEAAITDYLKNDYLSIEWPLFQNFLKTHDELTPLQHYQKLYTEKRFPEVAAQLLLRDDFYQYLRVDQYDYFLANYQQSDWFFTREAIHQKIQSTSYFAYGLIPKHISLLSLISHQFLHGSIMHLLGNLFFLLVCGFAVEAAVGHWRFLGFYLIGGIAGGLLHSVFNLGSTLPLVGASGAISGVMAMYLAIFRLKKIEFFYWFFVFVGYFRAPALFILPFYVFNEIFQYFSDTDSNVAFMAHAGGFISGALTIGGLLHYYPSLFNQDYIEEDQDHNPRQEALAIIYKQVERYQFKEAYGALNEFITQYGSNFDLSLLRYNLGKINNENTTKKDAIALCKTHRPSIYETEKLATLWQENLELQTTLDDSSILKLGLAFSNLPNPAIAEAIFEQLNENKVNDPSLGILARKLAAAFTKKNMPAKKQHYDTIADTLLARSL